MNDSFVRKELIIWIIAGVVFSFLVFYLYVIYPVGPPDGTPAELTVLSLVDDGENDYIDIKLVREGTGRFGFGYFSPLFILMRIKADDITRRVEVMGDTIRIDDAVKKLPEEFKLIGDVARVGFYVDVVEKGKTYRIELYQLFGILVFEGDVLCT